MQEQEQQNQAKDWNLEKIKRKWPQEKNLN